MTRAALREISETDDHAAASAPAKGGYAPLANMSRAGEAMARAVTRPDHLPGLVVLHGPSGYGKTAAAGFVAAMHDAAYVEAKSFFTQKFFLSRLARELGVVERARTIAAIAEAICDALAERPRPIIIDEADHVVAKGFIELIRDIHDTTGAPVMLVGEERLPEKLAQWERVHRRILHFEQMRPGTVTDALALRDHYARGVHVEDDLVLFFLEKTKGVIGRVVVNLERAREIAVSLGRKSIDRDIWGARLVETGQPHRGAAFGDGGRA